MLRVIRIPSIGVVGRNLVSVSAKMSKNNLNSELAKNERTDGPVLTSVRKIIVESFPDLAQFQIYNDSYKHSGHHGIADSPNKTESHIKLEIVSDKFNGLSLPNRHRMVYKLLNDDMKKYHIHAVQLSTKTVEEYNKTKK